MAVGGYRGTDQILTRGQLADLIRGGVMRFFLLPKTAETLTLAPELRQYLQELQRIGPEIGYATPVSLITWVHAHCLTVVPATWYRHLPQSSPDSTISSEAIFDLYDCSSLLSNASY
jgi:hypothetical protein